MAATNRIYITGYMDVARDNKGQVIQCGMEPSVEELNVDISSTSAQSAALSEASKFISIYADSDCHILIGENPTAVQTKKKMAAGSTYFCGVSRGGLKVAVIAEES